MILIPRCHVSPSHEEYWDKIAKKTGCKTSEWYGGYHILSGILHKYIKPTDTTLIIGGGNSHLSEDLYDVGYHSLVSLDASEAVVKQMTDRNSKARPLMRFIKMDVMQMDFDDGSVNAVLDKGWLDSIMAGSQEGAVETASCFFDQIHRILKMGGRYVCITLAADQTARHLLEYFSEKGCMVRLHQVTRAEQVAGETQLKSQQGPVFAFVCTKFKSIPGMSLPLEVCLTDAVTPQRVESGDKILTVIAECRHYAIVRHQLQTKTGLVDRFSVEFYDSTKLESPRYTTHVVDSDSKNYGLSQKFAIFITPQGRETEWMFSTDKGRRKLAESAGFQRLLVVSLHRDHFYTDMSSIKAELSSQVMELAPPGLDESIQVPFISVGDDIGQRDVLYRGNSQWTGDFVVEDVKSDDGETFRRLLFLSGTLIQSQARLKKERPRKGRQKQKDKGSGSKVAIDFNYLDFNFHKHMVAGLAAVPQFLDLLAREMRLLIVGLGAGILPMFLHQHFPKLLIDVVELDAAIAEVAKSCFEFTEDERMKVSIADGLEYITRLAEETTSPTYHVVLFDVDAKDLSTGLNSPPRPFIEKAFLKKVDSILHPQGLFMLNLISRDDSIKQDVINDIKTVFPSIFTKGGKDEVNETLYAISKARHKRAPEQDTEETSKSGQDAASPSRSNKEQLSSLSDDGTANSASELLGRLPTCGKQLQKLAQSCSKGLWDHDLDLSLILANLQIR
ncbi:methyltransferase-like protein 13 [Acanthaster planci]|uniref:Methyltransferase-like protein 13 n=1 Tax=Acanthaster planci TaxID=133434 RepID=A0A8B7YR54_ACAPL|nr:methyltransferase-like protein 13 [Acanthaster planci]XP_022094934.1 methyltransferase-like protein 13 [Acanthaster planci]XP_022094935.1 methyltransferase-like protein 13 [Acanthaster planci]XP_022094936.1 methyltransferase-like protein 13 [Acanthaster planci]